MFYLIFSILSSTIIAFVFKLQSKFKIKLFPVIVINYITATLLGFLLMEQKIVISEIVNSNWLLNAIFVGCFLIVGFYLIGYSTQKVGISITTISNKMSVVLPMMISIFLFNENITFKKILGFIIAFISIILISYQKNNIKISYKVFLLPIILFFSVGVIDAIVKIVQNKIDENFIPLFAAVSFGISGFIGLIISFFNKTKFSDFYNPKIIFTGIVIGSANFGSMYFLMLALNSSKLDSSVVFGLNNICIILLSVLIAIVAFKEKLKLVNYLGILLSVVAILLLINL